MALRLSTIKFFKPTRFLSVSSFRKQFVNNERPPSPDHEIEKIHRRLTDIEVSISRIDDKVDKLPRSSIHLVLFILTIMFVANYINNATWIIIRELYQNVCTKTDR